MRRWWILLLVLLAGGWWLAGRDVRATAPALGDGPAPVVHGHVLKHRWVYLPNNFQAQGNVERMNALLDRAKAAGYNGALVSDVKFDRLDDGSLIPVYYTNLQAVLQHAKALGLDIVPSTANFGYSSSLLWHNPDLAEGLPVRDAPFRAEGGHLVPYEAEPVPIVNADFETLPASGDQFPGWAWQDKPGEASFVDRQVKHGGRASLRMENLGTTNAPHGNGRIHQRLRVEPFRYYHVSVWIKTQDFQGGEVRVLALGQNPSRTLQWSSISVRETQDWTRTDVTFNTLTHNEVLFYFGVWGGRTGTIWWDDGAIEPAGFTNVIRRPGAPVKVASADGATAYEEGRDVARIEDPKMGRVPYNGVYTVWHEPPVIALRNGSRIRDGEVVKVSYYHMTTTYDEQVTASLTEPQVFEIVRGQLASIKREFDRAGMFQGWMFNHDEIRVHGWDEAPGYGSPGKDLAYNFGLLAYHAWEIAPAAALFTWSDMFDPYHNAADTEDPYYLVNGNWSGSWEGVPPEVVLLNWNSQPDQRRDSAAFFAERGHRQILAGYYDAPVGQFRDRDWLKDLEGVPAIEGVMYTQWYSGYDNLEAWARHVWGDAPWVTATPPSGPSPTQPEGPSPTSAPATNTPPPTVEPTQTPYVVVDWWLYLPLLERSGPGRR